MIRLRRVWLQIHKWLGISLAVLIVPISLSGAVLVWHEWLDETINPQRYPTAGARTLPPSDYVANALRLAEPGERLTSLAFPGEHGSVQATLSKPAQGAGRPSRAWVWLDPATAKPIERAATGEGALRVLHVVHGSLMVPGTGRQIVGWVGVAMLISSLTGLWLWWPIKGGVRSGLRWRRRPDPNANLHHLAGFWIALPLAALSFTGVWIAFPSVFSGAQPQRNGPAQPMQKPTLTADQALAAAEPFAPGRLLNIAFPTERDGSWTVRFDRNGTASEVKVSDSDGVASAVPAKPETFARTMRRIHDGAGMPLVWRIVIFVGGILPALLAVTGILMWLRMRRRRDRHRRNASGLVEAGALAN